MNRIQLQYDIHMGCQRLIDNLTFVDRKLNRNGRDLYHRILLDNMFIKPLNLQRFEHFVDVVLTAFLQEANFHQINSTPRIIVNDPWRRKRYYPELFNS